MAVLVEGFTVVIRNRFLESLLQGGQIAFLSAWPEESYCADKAITRVAFLRYTEAKELVTRLQDMIPVGSREGEGDVGIVTQSGDWLTQSSWIGLGTIENDLVVAWDMQNLCDGIVVPKGWTFERRLHYVSRNSNRQHLELVNREGQMLIYQDPVTKTLYYGVSGD